MNKIKQYKWHIISITILTIAFTFTAHRVGQLMERVSGLESHNNVEELINDMLSDRYDECVTDAYNTYSNDWDKACWNSGEDSDCRLNVLERYSVENQYHTDLISCLAQFKD